MSIKKVSRQKTTSVAQRKLRSRPIVAIAVMFGLLASIGALARRAHFATPSETSAAQLLPDSLSIPSKEYVYAGGRLVATEEPPPIHHASTIGVFRPNTNYFYLRNSNAAGNPDISVPLGGQNDLPIVGDWDGNGTFTIGVFRPGNNNTFYLSNNNATGLVDVITTLGAPGDLPIVGDWDGNGTTTIGVFRPGINGNSNTFYLKNTNIGGTVDIISSLGAPGDLPIAGDWDGDGDMTIGVYRPSTSTFYLSDGSTIDTVPFGAPGDLAIVGDWDGNGTWTIGLYRQVISTFYLRNINATGNPDLTISYGDGSLGDKPVAGDWDGL
jgi:hypothetical protein